MAWACREEGLQTSLLPYDPPLATEYLWDYTAQLNVKNRYNKNHIYMVYIRKRQKELLCAAYPLPALGALWRITMLDRLCQKGRPLCQTCESRR